MTILCISNPPNNFRVACILPINHQSQPSHIAISALYFATATHKIICLFSHLGRIDMIDPSLSLSKLCIIVYLKNGSRARIA